MVAELQPTIEQYEEVAAANRRIGESVPENVSQGLRDVNLLKAISGDLDAIQYMIGAKLSTEP